MAATPSKGLEPLEVRGRWEGPDWPEAQSLDMLLEHREPVFPNDTTYLRNQTVPMAEHSPTPT